ncbi:MAG: hypothetical protein Q8R83_01550 [Legionellaceae bacterium]|nr:hypothetical protein [Legionellaceae bacterium]
MFTKEEKIEKFDRLIGFCSRANAEIGSKIVSISTERLSPLIETRAYKTYLNDIQTPPSQDSKEIDAIQAAIEQNTQEMNDAALKVARLAILQHSIWLITQQLEALGSPYKVTNKNKDEFRPLSFWEKTHNQHATFYTNKKNIQSIQMVNELYNSENYEFEAMLNFIVEFTKQTNLDRIIKPVDNIYYFMFYAFLGLVAALCAATALATIYTTPFVAAAVLVSVLTLLALTSLSSLQAYTEQHALFSSKYKPLAKTHSFLTVFRPINEFDKLVTENICKILGQDRITSGSIRVNALAQIELEQIRNDYLSPAPSCN